MKLTPPDPDMSPRDRILAAASELFYKEGIHGVGVDTVVARSCVAKMTLYHHFRSKDQLVTEVLARWDEAWLAWLEQAVRARRPAPRSRCLAVFDALGEWFESPDFRGSAPLNAFAELPDRGHPALEVARRHARRFRGLLETLAREDGLAAPEATADALLLLAEGAIMAALVEGSGEPAARARAAASVLVAKPRRSPRRRP